LCSAQEEFVDLCFQFGVELDDVVEEEGETYFKIDIAANRADLLSIEGLALSVRVFLGLEKMPTFKVVKPEIPIQMFVRLENTKKIRPYIVCGVMRNCNFTPATYRSFIDYQDKLHHNICRKRSLVAIGTHDLDTIRPPFYYDAEPVESIRFRPLNMENEMSGREILDHYIADTHMRPFAKLISDSPVLPVIRDSDGVVLSLPPLINGDHSKIRPETKNTFIEMTATDLTRAKTVLSLMMITFSWACESCEIFVLDGEEKKFIETTPSFAVTEFETDVDKLSTTIGKKFTAEEIVSYLSKMMLDATIVSEKKLLVKVPPTRPDILHECDIVEDVAIAYGYNKLIGDEIKDSSTVGQQLPINRLTDLARLEMAFCGFTEVLTLALCSENENFFRMWKSMTSVKISNPKTTEFQEGRMSLVPGVLKTVQSNRSHTFPLRLFEVSDVMLLDSDAETGAKNVRMCCGVYVSNSGSGFEIIHGMLDRLLLMLGCVDRTYVRKLEDCSYTSFFPGRAAEVCMKSDDTVVGVFGVMHPTILEKFEIGTHPVSLFELNIEPFC
jgi:phenylalanyl-tRNA synthetase beta chain